MTVQKTIYHHDSGRFSHADGYAEITESNTADVRWMIYIDLTEETAEKLENIIDKYGEVDVVCQSILQRIFNGKLI